MQPDLIARQKFIVEFWAPIDGFEGIYEISNLGKVKSLSRTLIVCPGYQRRFKERILNQSLDTKGYWKVILCNSASQHKTVRVHRLIAKAFIPNHDPCKDFVNHKNGIKTDNRIQNLEWCTHAVNCQHAQDMGLNLSRFSDMQKEAIRSIGKKNRKITDDQVKAIRAAQKATGYGPVILSRILNINPGIIGRVIYGLSYKEIL